MLRQQLADYKELRKQLKNAVKSANLSKQISEASSSPVKTSPGPIKLKSTKAGQTLLIVNPNPPTVQVQPATPDTINGTHQTDAFTGNSAGISKSDIKSRAAQNQNLAATSPSDEASAQSAKIRAIRDLLSQVKFDETFHKICRNCATALDECEQVLHVSIKILYPKKETKESKKL